MRAAGAVVAATDWVLGGDNRRAFCAVRPPGHHAEPATAMGFCLFDNIAVAAAHAFAAHGIARIAKGEAIAAGMPEDKMPVVTVEKDEFTPAMFNTVDFTNEMAGFLKTRFGEKRVMQLPPVMGGEDFSRFSREENKDIKSLIIWVGGVPQAEYDAAKKEGRTLPSLHSPFWAPDAPVVISTATEALTAMAMKLMPGT